LGTAFGGEPGKINYVSNANEAANLLQGQGNLLECIREFFDPGNDLSPAQVGIYRYNTAVQASAILTSGATANNEVTIQSKDYGILFNQITYKVTAGTLASSKKFTEAFKGQENVIDNIIRASFTILYDGTPGAMTITVAAGVATTLATTVTGGSGGNLSITLSDYPKVDQLIAFINAQAGYTCVAVSANVANEDTADLDATSGVSIVSSPYEAHSDTQAMIEEINDKSSFFDATIHAAATRIAPIDNVASPAYLTGGSEGNSTTTEFTAALLDLEDEDVQLIGVAAEDAALNALVTTHVTTTNSESGKRERQAILPVAASTIDTGVTEAAGKNSFPICYTYGKYKRYNVNGVLTDFTSMMHAAKLLGIAVAVSLNEPLTNKSLNMEELVDKPTIAQQNAAIDAGLILSALKGDGTVRVVRQVTSSKLEDLKYVEFSMVREMLFMSRDLRTGAEALYIGKAGTPNALVDLESYCRDKLTTYENTEQMLISDPDDPTGNPGWRDLQITVNGDTVRITWVGNIVAPINFIFITSYFDVLVQAA
jgi:hypothetical protein